MVLYDSNHWLSFKSLLFWRKMQFGKFLFCASYIKWKCKLALDINEWWWIYFMGFSFYDLNGKFNGYKFLYSFSVVFFIYRYFVLYLFWGFLVINGGKRVEISFSLSPHLQMEGGSGLLGIDQHINLKK